MELKIAVARVLGGGRLSSRSLIGWGEPFSSLVVQLPWCVLAGSLLMVSLLGSPKLKRKRPVLGF